jgi:3-hydroxyethyl bacteriochlorophyllide a dehydrogenase
MREVKFRIAAEWQSDDMTAVNALIDEGVLSLDSLVTHRAKAVNAKQAYVQAFEDPTCYKMVLDWETVN